MAISISKDRLEYLRAEFEKAKAQIDQIDRKYSLDYVEPLMDMPPSLDLEHITFRPYTETELRALADEQVYASYLEAMRRLDAALSSDKIRIEKKLNSIEENARRQQYKLLAVFNAEVAKMRKRLTDNGILFSSVITSQTEKYRKEYDSSLAESNTQADSERAAVSAQLSAVEEKYAVAKQGVEDERQAKAQVAYNKLVQSQLNEQTRIEKYNTQLDEKEKKYLVTRAKALEQARQAEYNRTYAAKKLYQQMGATGYEEAKLWEKYNVFVKHFANFTKRDEALALIQGDSYVRNHLQQYYTTLLDWVDRNVPA